jgi:V/A-type H+-transporting ATPase subunit C
MVNSLDYSHPVARIRVLENKLINSNQIERLVDSKEPKAFFEVLSDSAYANHFNLTDNPSEFQKIINQEIKQTKFFLEKNNPFPDQLDWLWLKYDVLNIKSAIKYKLSNQDISPEKLSDLGSINKDKIIKSVYNIDKTKLDIEFQDMIDQSIQAFKKNSDPRIIDQIIDKSYFKILHQKLSQVKSRKIKEYIKSKIDLYNIKLIFRNKSLATNKKLFSQYVVNGGNISKSDIIKSYDDHLENIEKNLKFFTYRKLLQLSLEYFTKYNSFILFEKLSYDFLIDQLRFAKYEPFGIEPLVGYFLAKDNEAKLLRIIMISKINNIESNIIHQQLRKLYLER